MKSLIYLLSISILLSSCMVGLPIYSGVASNQKKKKEGEGQTHKEFMSEIRTKKDVVRSFGVASEKYNEEGIEIWVYNYGTVTQSSERISSNDNIKIKSNSNSTITGNNNYTGVSNRQTSSYTKYVEFQFDDGENVAYWRSKGIDKSWNNHSEILKSMKYHGGFMFAMGCIIDSALSLILFMEY